MTLRHILESSSASIPPDEQRHETVRRVCNALGHDDHGHQAAGDRTGDSRGRSGRPLHRDAGRRRSAATGIDGMPARRTEPASPGRLTRQRAAAFAMARSESAFWAASQLALSPRHVSRAGPTSALPNE